MNVRRGDIVLVDFPYSDHTDSKVRPALVVQADVWNQRLDDTILALITSSRRRRIGAATQFVIIVWSTCCDTLLTVKNPAVAPGTPRRGIAQKGSYGDNCTEGALCRQ